MQAKNPLNIHCRCDEYKKIVDACTLFTIGTQNLPITKIDIEPVASAKVSWLLATTERHKEISYPVLRCHAEEIKVDPTNVDKKWIPRTEYLISSKDLRPNLCHLHETERNTQSAVISTLTDMLPHRGRAVKRKDIDWGKDSCVPAVRMTDQPETHFGHVQSCFSKWAEVYTKSTGLSAY